MTDTQLPKDITFPEFKKYISLIPPNQPFILHFSSEEEALRFLEDFRKWASSENLSYTIEMRNIDDSTFLIIKRQSKPDDPPQKICLYLNKDLQAYLKRYKELIDAPTYGKAVQQALMSYFSEFFSNN